MVIPIIIGTMRLWRWSGDWLQMGAVLCDFLFFHILGDEWNLMGFVCVSFSMKINGITNKNKNLEEKINFFFDYFSFANQFIGTMPFLPLDTPISILDKIHFQLSENRKNRFHIYTLNHLLNFDFFDTTLFNGFNSFSEFKSQHDRLKLSINDNTNNGKIKWKNVKPIFDSNFTDSVENFRNELNKDFLNHLLKVIYTQIVCPHSLRSHKKSLSHMAVILAASFRLKGHSLKTTQEIVGKILTNSIDKAILPIELQNSDRQSKENFLNASTFKEQFDRLGILYDAIDNNFGFFLLKIDNCYPYHNQEKTFKLAYEDVTFISPKHSDLKHLRKKARLNDGDNKYSTWNEYFFLGKKYIIAYVKVYFEDDKEGVRIALGKINQAVNFLKVSKKGKINLIVNQSGYMITEDFKSFRGSKSLSDNLPDFLDQDTLKQNLELDGLSSTNPLIEYFLSYENLYHICVLENSPSKYWQYLECLLPKEKNTGDNQIKKIVKIARKNSRRYIRRSMASAVGLSIAPLHSTGLRSWSREEQIIFYNQMRKQTDRIDVFLISKKNIIDNQAIKFIISQLQSEFSKKKLEDWLRFLDSILTECQEYRNQEVHKFKVNPFLDKKLKMILPDFIDGLRWIIVDIFERKPNANIEDVFED